MLRCAIVVLALGAASAAQAQTDRYGAYLQDLREPTRERSVREILGHDPYVATPTPPIPRSYQTYPNRELEDLKSRVDQLEWQAGKRWF